MNGSAPAMNKLLLAIALCAMTTAAPAPVYGGQAPESGDAAPFRLVACAPGYPSNTEQAQPTMNDFAAIIAAAAGWPQGALTAEYHPTEEAGISHLRDDATSLALVPLPLYLKYEQQLELTAVAQAIQASGSATERWSLVVPTGSIDGPQSLSGWELLGLPAYAPRFVRGPALSSWGRLPASLSVRFTRRVLEGVRRVAAGEKVAVLLNGPQTAALSAVPGADSLEVVATSPPLLAWLVVIVGDRVGEPARQQLIDGLLGINASANVADVLETMQLRGFELLDTEALAVARAAYSAAQ